MTELERVRYVTAQYWNMQGLKHVAMGVALLGISAVRWWETRRDVDGMLIVIAEIGIWIAGLTAAHLAGVRYRDEYGHVQPRKAVPELLLIALLLTIPAQQLFQPPVSLTAMCLGTLAAIKGIECEGLRRHYLALATGCFVYAVLPLFGVRDGARFMALPAAGIALIIAGVGDHLVLRRTVSSREGGPAQHLTRASIPDHQQ